MAAPLSDPSTFDTDVAIIGSGFGGSVAAMRLPASKTVTR